MFGDLAFERELIVLFRQARWGAANAEEVLVTASRIRDHDPDSWVSEWVWTAGEAWAAANHARARGQRRRAAALYLHAAGYYGAALSQIARAAERNRSAALWQRHRSCWDQGLSNAPTPGQRFEIPYGAGSLPGYFFAAPGGTGCRRPLVVMHNGAYGPTSAMWGLGGAAGAQRGYHWMTFDGPGQQAGLHERRLFFRPDWEHVLTPVLDAVIARPDVDTGRIAAIGTGQAGYWLPRAMAFEHRLAAAVLEPGVVDVATAWIQALPMRLRAILRAGDAREFDREVRAALLFTPRSAQRLRACAAAYGLRDAPPSRIFQTVAGYRLADETAKVRTPMLVIESELEAPWPGQSRRLAGLAGQTARLLRPGDTEIEPLDWLGPFLNP